MNALLTPRAARRAALICLSAGVSVLAGCQIHPLREPPPPPPPPPPVVHAPLALHEFRIDPKRDSVIGQLQVTKVSAADTLSDVARRFNVGFEEIVRANPDVDPWLPGEGTQVVIPTQYVLPDAPREGVVINLAQLRLYYFPKPAKGEPDDGKRTVITYPVGIGKVGWETPVGTTKVVSKRRNPIWTPPLSVRREHRERGETLPARVPPGPDNPLGVFAMNFGWPAYLMHGTNKPAGVGLRASAGCIRLYPEDIAAIFPLIPVGTPVTVVNQPFVSAWHEDALYVQAFPVMEDDDREHPKAAVELLNAAISDDMWLKIKEHDAALDLDLIDAMVASPQGIAVPVSRRGISMEALLSEARLVRNQLPAGTNWDGKEELMRSAEEYEAAIKARSKQASAQGPQLEGRAVRTSGGAGS